VFSRIEIEKFHEEGYVIAPGLASREVCAAMTELTELALAKNPTPVEYESDLHYPGAPASREAPGGRTVRRLLQAYSRHPLFSGWATYPEVVARVRQLLGPQLVLPQAHHNCIMTKHPRFSSDTYWHQDIRYWSFERPDLISVWLALGPEFPENGCLDLLPGTHKMVFARERLDEAFFLRTDLPENRRLIATQIAAQLNPGDALFFHARTFHAAGRNRTDLAKFSLVFTYRPADNRPLPGTRSASKPEVSIAE
jgi:phytanoyl-CoA hydroxylase